MKYRWSLRNLCSKSTILKGLTALAGFAAGVLMAGLITLEQSPRSEAAEPVSAPASTPDFARAEPIPVDLSARPAVAGPWAFESAPAAPAQDPGKARPDRLSAPEGWTYVAGGPAE